MLHFSLLKPDGFPTSILDFEGLVLGFVSVSPSWWSWDVQAAVAGSAWEALMSPSLSDSSASNVSVSAFVGEIRVFAMISDNNERC